MPYEETQRPIEQHYHVEQRPPEQPRPQPPPKTVLQVGMEGLSWVLSIGLTILISPTLIEITEPYFHLQNGSRPYGPTSRQRPSRVATVLQSASNPIRPATR